MRSKNELIEFGNVCNGNALRTVGLAGLGIGAVAKAQLIHPAQHGIGAGDRLNLPLRQSGELGDLSSNKKHSRAVLASSSASATSNTRSSIHSEIGVVLGDGCSVSVRDTAGIDRDVTAGLDDLVIGEAVDHEVADDREGVRPPRLDGDDIAGIEMSHVELAGGDERIGAMRLSVDVERTGATDAFAAVVVESNGFEVLSDEVLVEDVERFKERRGLGDAGEWIGDEMALSFGAVLSPDLEGDVNEMIHRCKLGFIITLLRFDKLKVQWLVEEIRLGVVRVELPAGDVGEVLVLSKRLTLRGLVFLPKMAAAGFGTV